MDSLEYLPKPCMVKSLKRLKLTFEMRDMEEFSGILLLNGSMSSARSKEKKSLDKGANLH